MAISITYQFWSSDNGVDWTGPESDIADVANSKYIKVKVNMSSDEAGKVPVLEDMTVGYFRASDSEANWIFHNVSEDEFTCPACKEISAGECVNIVAGQQDTVGPNKCEAAGYACDGNGNCVPWPPGCPTCQEWDGEKCVNTPAGQKGTGCQATHYRCDGNGNCTAPTHDFWGPCLNWDDPGDIPGNNDCETWCKNQGYIDCVCPGMSYYQWDESCIEWQSYYSCSPSHPCSGLSPNSTWGPWPKDDGKSWKCHCKDYVYD